MVQVYANCASIYRSESRIEYKIVSRENALINKITMMKLVVLVGAFVYLAMALSVEGV